MGVVRSLVSLQAEKVDILVWTGKWHSDFLRLVSIQEPFSPVCHQFKHNVFVLSFCAALNLSFQSLHIVLNIVVLNNTVDAGCFLLNFGDFFHGTHFAKVLQMNPLCSPERISCICWSHAVYKTVFDWVMILWSSIDKKRKDSASLPSLCEHVFSIH